MARRNAVATSGTVQVQGLKELERTLLELGSVPATKIGRAANRKAAQSMLEVTKATAPYGTKDAVRSRTSRKGVVTRTNYGHLRDNLNVRLAKARKETTITYTVGIGAAFWGYFQEFGTRFMAARPWMRPAFDVSVPTALNVQADQLRAGIEREAKRIAKANGSV